MKIEFTSELISLGGTDFSSANEIVQDLSSLSSLFPKDFDIEANHDVFPFVAPMAVANLFNRNGVGIDYAGAIQIKDKLAYKYVDYEHNNKNIIGTILNAGFSSLEDEEFEGDETSPFFINNAAILYKEVNERLISEIMRASDPLSSAFGSYSVSWEIDYEKYDIALGSINVSECEIIKDVNQKREFASLLKIKGGSGMTNDGVPVFQLLGGNLTPIGIGIVRKPAAFVRGLYGIESTDTPSYSSTSAKKIFDMAANNSQLNVKHVNLDRTNMDEILELLKKIEAAVAKPEEGGSSVASLTKLFADQIREKNQEWLAKKGETEEALRLANEASANAQASVATLTETLNQTKARLEQLEADAQVSAANELFSARMEKIDQAYKLEDDLRAIVAGELKSLSSEESAFDAYFTKTQVLLKGREKNEDDDKKITLASAILEKTADAKVTFEDIKLALASADIEISDIPNSTPPPPSDNKERWAKAFAKDQIKIEL